MFLYFTQIDIAVDVDMGRIVDAGRIQIQIFSLQGFSGKKGKLLP